MVKKMIHGNEPMLPRVKAVEVHPDYQLLLTFNNGEKKVFDAKPLLEAAMYRDLGAVFSAARVEYGTVVWPGDMDVSPDMLYLRSVSA